MLLCLCVLNVQLQPAVVCSELFLSKGLSTYTVQFKQCTIFLPPPGYQEVDLFSEIRGVNFDNVFGSMGQQQQASPSSSLFANSYPQQATGGPPMIGDILLPQAVGPLASRQMQLQPQRLTKDVDSSLARAAENLSMSSSTSNNLLFSSASSAFSPPWPSGPQPMVHVGTGTGKEDIFSTGSSPWTTTAGGKTERPHGPGVVHGLVTKNPLDDIVIPESLFAGTVGVKTDKVSCGVCMLW